MRTPDRALARTEARQARPKINAARGRLDVLAAILAASLLTAAQPWGDDARAQSVDSPQPNVLIVLTDDQRDVLTRMPKTRAFFGSGVRFRNAYATTPLCCPARVSILTGLYVHNHGVVDNDGTGQEGIDHDASVPAYLREAGYRTGYFGKYINHWQGGPLPYFDDYASMRRKGFYDTTWDINGVETFLPRYSTHLVSKFAVDFIRRAEVEADEQPWFAVAAPYAPHAPYIAEPKYAAARIKRWNPNPAVSEQDLSDKPPAHRGIVTRWRGRHVRRSQLRTLMSVDDMMGRIDELLTGLGERQNTLVFYLSDNGFLWGEHGLVGKRRPYEQSTRIPMLMRWPAQVRSGTDNRLVANIDLAPTILDAADIEQKFGEPMDGRSLLTAYERTRMLLEHLGKEAWAAIRTPTYQYTEHYTPSETGVPYWQEYYDMILDPYQMDSLLGEVGASPTPPWAATLSEQLLRDRRCSGTSCP